MPDFVPTQSPPHLPRSSSTTNNDVLLSLGNRMIPSPPEGYGNWSSTNLQGSYGGGQNFGRDRLSSNGSNTQQTMSSLSSQHMMSSQQQAISTTTPQMLSNQQSLPSQHSMTTPQMLTNQQSLPSQQAIGGVPYHLGDIFQDDSHMPVTTNDRHR